NGEPESTNQRILVLCCRLCRRLCLFRRLHCCPVGCSTQQAHDLQWWWRGCLGFRARKRSAVLRARIPATLQVRREVLDLELFRGRRRTASDTASGKIVVVRFSSFVIL